MTTADLALTALADPCRRRIVELLADGAQPVRVLQSHFSFSQPALSKHLRVLRDASLVTFEKHGREHRYALNGETLRSTAEWMLELHAFWASHLDTLGDLLDEEATP